MERESGLTERDIWRRQMEIENRAARTLLYEEVVRDLYQIIDEEHLRPGDKLPP